MDGTGDVSLVANSILEEDHSMLSVGGPEDECCTCGKQARIHADLPEGFFDHMPGSHPRNECAKCEHARMVSAGFGDKDGNPKPDYLVPCVRDKEYARSHHLWLVYNESILRGYRVNYHSWKLLCKSAVGCHNETTNFWSHFVGVFIFGVFLVFFSAYYAPLDLQLNIVESARNFGNNPKLIVSEYFQTAIDKIYDSSSVFNASFFSPSDSNSFVLSTANSSVWATLESMKSMETELKEYLTQIDLSTVDRYT